MEVPTVVSHSCLQQQIVEQTFDIPVPGRGSSGSEGLQGFTQDTAGVVSSSSLTFLFRWRSVSPLSCVLNALVPQMGTESVEVELQQLFETVDIPVQGDGKRASGAFQGDLPGQS